MAIRYSGRVLGVAWGEKDRRSTCRSGASAVVGFLEGNGTVGDAEHICSTRMLSTRMHLHIST